MIFGTFLATATANHASVAFEGMQNTDFGPSSSIPSHDKTTSRKASTAALGGGHRLEHGNGATSVGYTDMSE